MTTNHFLRSGPMQGSEGKSASEAAASVPDHPVFVNAAASQEAAEAPADEIAPPTAVAPAAERRPGRRKINIEYIQEKDKRHITFSKRKAGIMKKAFELSTLTGTQVLLVVASETGHVYTFATRKLKPLITQSEGKNLIQTCLNAPEQQPQDSPHAEDYDDSTAVTHTGQPPPHGGDKSDMSTTEMMFHQSLPPYLRAVASTAGNSLAALQAAAMQQQQQQQSSSAAQQQQQNAMHPFAQMPFQFPFPWTGDRRASLSLVPPAPSTPPSGNADDPSQ
eukprot:TRINITY_DN6208_c0_g1_i2.p1 TRINITY_DN6208_c0_g1~~TRINITY_DN6208_c0_g1_i2.p1  ORF type:complete len:303 (-),score=69.92 TRINITY_DN6208_c0_g1_i2:203-1033(-)